MCERRTEKIAASRKPNSVPRLRPLDADYGAATTIPLARPSLAGSSDLPGGSDGPSVARRDRRARLPIWSCSVRGFACHRCYQRRGALLPHLFTLTHRRPRSGPRRAVCFLCHFPSGCPDRALPGALSCGVRTFLPPSRLFEPLRRGKPLRACRAEARESGRRRTVVWLAANLYCTTVPRPNRSGAGGVLLSDIERMRGCTSVSIACRDC